MQHNIGKGTLYLIPTFLSEETDELLSAGMLKIIHTLDTFIAENEKSARAFLKKTGTPRHQQQFLFFILDEHTQGGDIDYMLEPLLGGKDTGMMSEAGTPGVADPGSIIVRKAHEKGIRVVPLQGASSIILALMSSGMNGQQFVFHGYIPRDASSRKKKLREMEIELKKNKYTQIFIETPYRNKALFEDILSVCADETRFCFASDLTGKSELIKSMDIRTWKKERFQVPKIPAVFLLGN